ncbi:MAG: FAD-binding oxidoreductase [Pseudohongiellaceae bacterium]
MNPDLQTIVDTLTGLVGDAGIRTDSDALARYGSDWTRFITPNPCAVVLPANTGEVQQIVRQANLLGFSLVPSGGRTGLSGGAVAATGEVVIAFDRMNRILDFNPVDRQVVCEAGVVTGRLQEYAVEQGLYYPVNFASAGSSQIGGNAATNAGGIKVIRYGLTRNWVKGIKVVTGKGDLLDCNRGLTKNATGYDFRHLFVGSEGTLGLIVEVTIELTTPPRDPTVLLLGLKDLDAAMPVLQQFRRKLQLNAFEFFSEKALAHVLEEKKLQRPFESVCDFYALLEFDNDGGQTLDIAMAEFEAGMEAGWILDGTMSQSGSQAATLWRLREDISETISRFTPYKNDIAVKVSRVPELLREVDAVVAEKYPDFEIIWFGHIGDGNVHLNILKPAGLSVDAFYHRCGTVSEGVFDIVKRLGGSISAEHGVGLLKKPFLPYSRDPLEIEYMRALKKVFDPGNVLNPGKIFDSVGELRPGFPR